MDRAGLNITTFLATTVLQTEAKVSKLPTWLDLFFNVCMGYQTITFLVTVVGARRFGIQSARQTAEDATPSGVPVPVPDGSNPSKVSYFPGASKLAEKGNIRRHSVEGSALDHWLESHTPLMSSSAPARRPVGGVGFMAQQIIGDAADDMQDLFGTRFLIPSFLVVMIMISIAPNFNRDDRTHPDAGVQSPLFITNFILLCGWFLSFFTVLGDRICAWVTSTTRKAKRLSVRRSNSTKWKSEQAHTATEDSASTSANGLPTTSNQPAKDYIASTPAAPFSSEDRGDPFAPVDPIDPALNGNAPGASEHKHRRRRTTHAGGTTDPTKSSPARSPSRSPSRRSPDSPEQVAAKLKRMNTAPTQPADPFSSEQSESV